MKLKNIPKVKNLPESQTVDRVGLGFGLVGIKIGNIIKYFKTEEYSASSYSTNIYQTRCDDGIL